MENSKQQNFISSVRQATTSYRNLISTMQELSNQWGALYGTLITEEDFQGENLAVIPSGDTPETATRLESLTVSISNMQSIIATFDAGIDTNFERVTA